MYAVNGVHVYISADQYTLKDGGQIEWIYQKLWSRHTTPDEFGVEG